MARVVARGVPPVDWPWRRLPWPLPAGADPVVCSLRRPECRWATSPLRWWSDAEPPRR
ncbi:hypothetical protein [Nocardia wallacei]|uniref:hypothetical protein n=1 Tax=Nocardia wallacei TaxID=480035 RepID=UPI002455050E|nr:hypothetical protein [Nocardia wallacei]